MQPATFLNVLFEVNLAFYWRKVGYMVKVQEKSSYASVRALSADRMPVNSQSGEVQLKPKIILMQRRNYNKKHFRFTFTKRSKRFHTRLNFSFYVKNKEF
jgi:hypothetical protein